MRNIKISVFTLLLLVSLCSCSISNEKNVLSSATENTSTYSSESSKTDNIFDSSKKITIDGEQYICLTENELEKYGYFSQEHSTFVAEESYKKLIPYFEPASEKFGFLTENGKIITDPIYDRIEMSDYSWTCLKGDIYSLFEEAENEYRFLLNSDETEYDEDIISRTGNIIFEEHISPEADSGITYEFNKDGYFVNEYTIDSPDLCKVTMYDYAGNKQFSVNGFYNGYDYDFDEFGYLAIYPCKSYSDANELYIIDKCGNRILDNEHIIEYRNNMVIVINNTLTQTRLIDTSGNELLPYGFNNSSFMKFSEEDGTVNLFDGKIIEQDGSYMSESSATSRCDYKGNVIETL